MAITVDVKPDFSAFVPASAEEIAAAVGCDEETALAFSENYIAFKK